MEDENREVGDVDATIELTGSYERIAEIIGGSRVTGGELDAVVDDLEAVVEVVARTGGATKSGVAEELPSSVSADLDAESVIHVLRVLELYDVVVLDGNTWRPGPELAAGGE